MSQKSYQVTRWAAIVSLCLALVVGVMAGSLATARAARTVPVFLTAGSAGAVAGHVSFEAGFAPVVTRVLPAVVNVSSSKIVRTSEQSSPLSDPFFRRFFGDQFSQQFKAPRERREMSLGSGVIVSADGYILTNNHVVDGANDVKVALSDKREFTAHIVGRDSKTDIAVLKVAATNLPVLPFGDSTKMLPGNFVLAIGNPFGLSQTVTMGIVSATGRGNLGIEDYEDFIQTDAAINPGNSGGALINEQGSLIGINTAILSGGQGGGNEGVGFAIPVNMARQVMDQILKNGHVIRAWLGVSVQPVTESIAKAFGAPSSSGALVADVTPDSPAAHAGLEKGDIILTLDGQPVPDSRELSLKVAMMTPGTVAQLKIFRNGAQREIPVKLGEMPASQAEKSGPAESRQGALEGVIVDQLTPQIAHELQLPAGTKGVVVTSVRQAAPAAEAGLQRGDVIQEVNHKPVNTVGEFDSAMHLAGKQPVLLLVNHRGLTRFLVVKPE